MISERKPTGATRNTAISKLLRWKTFKAKITGLAVILSLPLLIVSGVVIYQNVRMIEESELLIGQQIPLVSYTTQLGQAITKTSILTRSYVIKQNGQFIDQWQVLHTQRVPELLQAFESRSAHLSQEDKQMLAQLQSKIALMKQAQEEIIQFVKQAAAQPDSIQNADVRVATLKRAGELFEQKAMPMLNLVTEELNLLYEHQQELLVSQAMAGQKGNEEQIVFILLLSILGTLLGSGLAFYIIRNLLSKIRTLSAQIQLVAQGELPETLPVTGDEIGEIIQATNTLIQNQHKAATFSHQIGQGMLDQQFAPAHPNDVLGNALLQMQQQLQKVALEDKRRNWTAEGLAYLVEVLRDGQHTDRHARADRILSSLVKYVGANQGALFTIQSGTQNLELVACYAYNRKKYLTKIIQPGEGLIGQAFLEADTIYLTEIPTNYLQITSGLGKSAPSCLLLVPLKINDKVLGILELASFTKLAPHEITFIEKLGESLASTIAATRDQQQMHLLLEESQQQTEMMRAQEEEMRQNMEELQATQEEMRRISLETQAQTSIINRIAIVSKTDLKGNITYANEEFFKWSKYSREEVIGKNHRFLKSGDQPHELFAELWETISRGEIFRGEIKNKAKDGTFYWVDAIIAPIIGMDGKPIEYIAQQFVMNNAKEKERKMANPVEQNQAR